MTGQTRPEWWTPDEDTSPVPPDRTDAPRTPAIPEGPPGGRRQHTGQHARDGEAGTHGGWGHRLLMLVCCIPMVAIVIALVASGAAGASSIIFAAICVFMMAAMMFMMPGGHRH